MTDPGRADFWPDGRRAVRRTRSKSSSIRRILGNRATASGRKTAFMRSARRLPPVGQARDRATFNSGARRAPDVSRIKAIAAWVAIIGGGIAFYFFYGVAAEWMR